MTSVRRAVVEAERSDVVDHLVRIGLVAYGVVHLLIAWLTLQIAFGETGKNASAEGAMHTLARQPLGEVLVWAIGIGFVILVLWRLLEVWRASVTHDGMDRVLKIGGKLVGAGVYAVLAGMAFQVAAVGSSGGGKGGGKGGGQGGGGGSTDSITAQVMSAPGGQLLVGAVGLGVIGYAGYLAYRGWTEKFLEDFDGSHGRKAGKAYRWIGKVGHVGKGVAFALVGGLFVWAAVTHDPKKSGGLDQALQELRDQPFGQVLLIAIAAGIACYGLFAFVWARHLSR